MSQAISSEIGLVNADRGAHHAASAKVAIIWMDWYAYHVARFRALHEHPLLHGRILGIEYVGGAGVHGDLVFRVAEREGLPITTLLPDLGWVEAGPKRVARALWSKLNEFNPDVVLIPGCYMLPGLAATVWARLHGKKAILMTESAHGDHPRSAYKQAVKGAILRGLYHSAIAGGTRHVDYLKQMGFREDQLARPYDVVDNDYFEREANECRRRGRGSAKLPGNYFLYVGRLAPEKNVDGLIRAFAEYRRGGGTWSLVLIGDGPCKGDLKQQATAEGVADFIHFTGLKSTREIAAYYSFAGCFVLASLREPWGLVANEAMAAGLPVILSGRCGCSDDLIDPEGNGYLFDPALPHELPVCLQKMANLSEERRGAMGQRSRDLISRFSPRLFAEEVVRLAGIRTVANHSVA